MFEQIIRHKRFFHIAIAVVVITATLPSLARSQDAEGARQKAPLTEKIGYFDDGKVMSCSRLTPEGRLVSKASYYHDGKVQKMERYNEAGEKIVEANYDNDGKLDNNFDGWAAKRWVYKDGNLRAESTYGEDGHLTERKIYIALGDLVDRQYVGDGKIDPNEEFDRAVVVTKETDHFYDEYGKETGAVTTEVDDPDDMLGDMPESN